MTNPLKRCARGVECLYPDGCWQPANLEHFKHRKRNKDGLDSRCKTCSKADTKAYRQSDHGRAALDRAKKKWLEAHPEEAKISAARTHLKHKDKHNAGVRAYRKEHSEAFAEASRKYAAKFRKANPDKIRTNNRIRHARKRGAPGTHTTDDILVMQRTQKDKCWWCGKSIANGYHIDHRIPLIKGGSNDASNLCLTCPKCNMQKHDKLPQEWNGRLL